MPLDSTTKNGLAEDLEPTLYALTACCSRNELSDRERDCRLAVDSLNDVGLADFLQHDPRPTFVLDLDILDEHQNLLQPVYCNPALLGPDADNLLEVISGRDNMNTEGAWMLRPYSKYRRWIFGNEMDNAPGGYSYSNMLWTKVIVKDRWSVVSGLQESAPACVAPRPDIQHRRESMAGPELTLDWTCQNPPSEMTDHIKFTRSVDWGATSLGPMSGWSPQLRLMSNVIMKDVRPGVLFWGPDNIMIYNEAYIPLIGDLHPACMGANPAEALADYWDHFEPIIAHNRTKGESVSEYDLPIFLRRNGIMEETYYSFIFIPMVDDNGVVVGSYEPIVETTRQKISERRLDTLLKVSEETARASNLETYWRLVIEVLATCDKDVPFALLYGVEEEEESSDGVSTSGSSTSLFPKQCVLKGSLGVPEGHPAAPATLDFQQGHEGFMPYFREALKSRRPTVLNLEDCTEEESKMMKGIKWRGFGDPCRSLCICPITPTSSKNVLGFLIVGLNPRRPYDEDYQQFMLVASRLLATSLASVVLHEEEIRRRENMIAQAELMRSQLTEQLFLSRKEVERNEKRFQRFCERADVAIFIVGSDGNYTYRNDKWFRLFQLQPEDVDIKKAWERLVEKEDLASCEAYFTKLMVHKCAVTFEMRLARTYGIDEHNMWVLCAAYPELDDAGDKLGERLQKQRTNDALESKRQLENFIDTTSHEMRNPLSAIIQCADGIITSHNAHVDSDADMASVYHKLLESGVDAAQTIVQCSQHMKCIVDDVLTMSKLDSGLLVMTPVDAQPEAIARHAVKMFEAEAKAADVSLDFAMEPTYSGLEIDWVSLDPTRLLQILINLITNAIKFTRLESRRAITVSLGASTERPVKSALGNVSYIRTATAAETPSLQNDWLAGPNVFISFTVQDTGRGLSPNEKDLLFARFSQASPRTHISYGGSGLGLFISRRLTEMQGGAIGFASEEKTGSAFSFYVRARRSQEAPTMDEPRARVPGPSMSTTTTTAPLKSKKTSTTSRPKLSRKGTSLPHPLHVLVVEDNLVNQRVLANQLRSIGCIVHVANHGGECLEFLRTTRYCADGGVPVNVILMDWEMPIMDGLTCVRKIRELQVEGTVRGHVPVIAVTANVRSEQIGRAMEAGMDDVVSKPFRVPELSKRMKTLMLRLCPKETS
ncbi:hypothetical protein K490DRAFT_43180 [Saccharata proteae CBS 121410]|uniref:Uncharacterized protein n=1 Tax=Saccharata proteae CBS 121410 TaxID=1314787 RepID=A0A9P4HS32_9PEZI|nr:hypothetical protein K490DRAFT_43180 [Saccharata proteae CBS 121410]